MGVPTGFDSRNGTFPIDRGNPRAFGLGSSIGMINGTGSSTDPPVATVPGDYSREILQGLRRRGFMCAGGVIEHLPKRAPPPLGYGPGDAAVIGNIRLPPSPQPPLRSGQVLPEPAWAWTLREGQAYPEPVWPWSLGPKAPPVIPVAAPRAPTSVTMGVVTTAAKRPPPKLPPVHLRSTATGTTRESPSSVTIPTESSLNW